MRTSGQINSFWRLARESSADGERFRRRIGALGAVTLAICAFLVIIGLGALVLAMLAGALASIAVLSFAAVWPKVQRRGGQGIERVRSGGRTATVVLVPLWRRTRIHAKTGGRYARRSTANALTWAGPRAAALARVALAESSRTGRALTRAARSTALRVALPRPWSDPQREALRLNAAGTQHRRNGLFKEAVECHRRALEILRALDDRRAVALTQSNLALALSHAGDDDWAIGLFEEAAATLRELGDEEHEAQIIANLGLTHRRHGRREEGDNVLELALSKLSPASSAYHTIEAELRRAS
jgi:tetratricopeptide (TPR) repeat protein